MERFGSIPIRVDLLFCLLFYIFFRVVKVEIEELLHKVADGWMVVDILVDMFYFIFITSSFS